MPKVKPEIWSRGGKKQFVILAYEEYRALCERLEDAEDFRLLEESKRRQANARTISHGEMMRRVRMKPKRRRKAG
jgi:hypothetical protein